MARLLANDADGEVEEVDEHDNQGYRQAWDLNTVSNHDTARLMGVLKVGIITRFNPAE